VAVYNFIRKDVETGSLYSINATDFYQKYHMNQDERQTNLGFLIMFVERNTKLMQIFASDY